MTLEKIQSIYREGFDDGLNMGSVVSANRKINYFILGFFMGILTTTVLNYFFN